MYRTQTIPFEEIPHFSQRDKAYQAEDERLRPFYQHEVAIDNLDQAVANRQQYPVDRKILHQVLTHQYNASSITAATKSNIDALLDEDTYTIITAHQPSILTGPLYFIYKICSIISVTRRLAAQGKSYKVVPVFVMGGEDHDFEEIASLHIYGKTLTWDTDQIGATGRMNLNGIQETIDQAFQIFGESPNADTLKNLITNALASATSYGEFMFNLLNGLFGQYGLIIANMDDAQLKQQFLPVALQDIDENFSHTCVIKDQKALATSGFKSQAHARDINLFFHDQDRKRIIKEEDHFSIGHNRYTRAELGDLLKNQPKNISPNVVLRPVFQEMIFPNLAYVGGGGELAYWLERKSLFCHLNLPFPMLVRRDSFLIVDRKSAKFVEDSGLSMADLFDRTEQLDKSYALGQTEVKIDLNDKKVKVLELFEEVATIAQGVDPTLMKTVMAEGAKAQKAIDVLEKRLIKAEKQKQEVGIKKIGKIKAKLFPNNDSLQERYDNFAPYFLRHGQSWIDAIINACDPFDKGFKILIEE